MERPNEPRMHDIDYFLKLDAKNNVNSWGSHILKIIK